MGSITHGWVYRYCHYYSVALDGRPIFSYIISISLIEGRLREGTFGSGASAVPPRGLATRSGAALGIIPFGITAEA
jgi:hypothetical protein